VTFGRRAGQRVGDHAEVGLVVVVDGDRDRDVDRPAVGRQGFAAMCPRRIRAS
jgi:hypothetical protein